MVGYFDAEIIEVLKDISYRLKDIAQIQNEQLSELKNLCALLRGRM
jgi:hypothetical protein